MKSKLSLFLVLLSVGVFALPGGGFCAEKEEKVVEAIIKRTTVMLERFKLRAECEEISKKVDQINDILNHHSTHGFLEIGSHHYWKQNRW
ncbi:hypothetical protein FACS1894152_3450 [Bacilli bacterium]|nr:hypothetical protein FACS1894152_3450 [Bacilli bacterium]